MIQMHIRLLLFIIAMCLELMNAQAQVFEVAGGSPSALPTVAEPAEAQESQSSGKATEYVVVTDGFWKDWFVQMGLDMTLQNPYGYDFSKVFPNGKSFGLDIAVGKWFSHQVGVRGNFNWENKLPLLENGHANWLAPFDQPGENRRKGGYIAVYGDALLNLHNLFVSAEHGGRFLFRAGRYRCLEKKCVSEMIK